MVYNHIDGIKNKLRSGSGVGALPCVQFMLIVIEQIKTVLSKYYEKMGFSTIYEDAMILNPCVKLNIFDEETWKDTSTKDYFSTCCKCFIEQYS